MRMSSCRRANLQAVPPESNPGQRPGIDIVIRTEALKGRTIRGHDAEVYDGLFVPRLFPGALTQALALSPFRRLTSRIGLGDLSGSVSPAMQQIRILVQYEKRAGDHHT